MQELIWIRKEWKEEKKVGFSVAACCVVGTERETT
jgi:hypothetical protein